MKRLSSLAMTAFAISGEILDRERQRYCVWKSPSDLYSIALFTINGVATTGTHLSTSTQRTVKVTNASGSFSRKKLSNLDLNDL